MIKIFEKDSPIKGALERSLPIFLGDDAEVVVANVDQLDIILNVVEEGKPVIFYGFFSESSLRLSGNKAVQYFYRKNTGYCQIPFNLTDVAVVYKDIRDGKKIENRGAMFAAKIGFRNNLVGILLHDLHPGKDVTKPMEKAEKEFGIAGSLEEVRRQLEEIRSEKGETTPIKNLIGDEIIEGVFCDIEGTIFTSTGEVNEKVLQMLEKEEGKRAVSIWTGGDVKEFQKKLYRLEVKKFPVLSKYSFRGCEVEIAIDDLSQDEFEKRYGIKVHKYIQV